jgi:hypothetical protein
VTNTGGTQTPPIRATLGGPDASQFTIVQNDCGTLAPGATCMLGAIVRATSPGLKQASLTVAAGPDLTASAELRGDASPGRKGLELEPLDVTYPATVVGQRSPPVTFTVRNASPVPVDTVDVVLTGTDFVIVVNGCENRTFPPGGFCAVVITFLPRTPGPKTGSLTVSPATIGARGATLQGTGLPL